MNHSEIVSFLWGVADLIRDKFKRGEYQNVILPLTVLRRIDCVLAPTRDRVRRKRAELKGRLENLDPQLRRASGFAFYNTSRYDFESLLGDPSNLAANLRNFIQGFSTNMREVIERFKFDNTIESLDEHGLLFKVVERFKNVDLHPDRVSNAQMGTTFEELIRKFNEALDENPGEHFTPRDVVHLMVDLMLVGDEARIRKPGVSLTICDPCCGSGGMLTIAREHIQGTKGRPGIAPGAEVHLFAGESQPQTFAICKSDLFMKSADGRDAENVFFGSTLAKDPFRLDFDYQIANPPYGKDWKSDEEAVRAEAEKGMSGRFGIGLPSVSDGQTLFLLHMLHHMKDANDGGARLAIIMNGSPLFTGDAGSGPSEIRRYVLENDLLEALVALPEQMFYNTGIATYVWVIANRKEKRRRGKVQLIDATSFWTPMRKSLGDKRREIPADKAQEILRLHAAFEAGEFSKIYANEHFGYRKITVERPLRLNFQASPERLARLQDESAFKNLAVSKKKAGAVKSREEAEGRKQQEAIKALLATLPQTFFRDREAFVAALKKAADRAAMRITSPVQKAILAALSERDETAEICRDPEGHPDPDPELRDTESVPLAEGVEAFFQREVRPHVPDAWIDDAVRDPKDGGVGKVGYEVNFNRYFYKYTPPRPLEEIEADIGKIEQDILRMLGEVTANHSGRKGK